MSEYQYAQLLADLADIAGEVFEDTPEVCAFDRAPGIFDFSDADYSAIYQERGDA